MDALGIKTFIYDGPVRDGIVLARFPKGYHQQQYFVAYDVVFGQGSTACGKSVTLVKDVMCVFVEAVLGKFDHEFFSH